MELPSPAWGYGIILLTEGWSGYRLCTVCKKKAHMDGLWPNHAGSKPAARAAAPLLTREDS